MRNRLREDRGGIGVGETEAGLGGGEGGGELRMVFAEVLGGEEDVVVAGGVEPVADGGPEVAWFYGVLTPLQSPFLIFSLRSISSY